MSAFPRRASFLTVASLAAALLGACGSSSGTNIGASATGTIGGHAFTAASAEGFAGGTAAANTGPVAGVVISSGTRAACSGGAAEDPYGLQGTTSLLIEAIKGGNAITTGTYTVGATDPVPKVFASTVINDSSCNDTGVESATSGTMTITALTATRLTGSYNLVFGSDTISGTFDIALCNLPTDQGDAGHSSPVCH